MIAVGAPPPDVSGFMDVVCRAIEQSHADLFASGSCETTEYLRRLAYEFFFGPEFEQWADYTILEVDAVRERLRRNMADLGIRVRPAQRKPRKRLVRVRRPPTGRKPLRPRPGQVVTPLRQARLDAGLTLRTVAEAAEIDTSALSAYETARRRCRSGLIQLRILAALGVSRERQEELFPEVPRRRPGETG